MPSRTCQSQMPRTSYAHIPCAMAEAAANGDGDAGCPIDVKQANLSTFLKAVEQFDLDRGHTCRKWGFKAVAPLT